MVKYFILVVLIVILASLASALLHMVRNKGSKEQMVRALSVRIALSIGLIGFIILAAALGWITPHGLIPAQQGG